MTHPALQQPLGRHGEPCAQCGAGLAADQRYCLNCGKRRADARIDFEHYLAEPVGGATPEAGAAEVVEAASAGGPPRRDYTAVYGVGLLMALGVMFVVGVLIGKEDSEPATTAQQPVIRLGGATAGTGAATSGGGGERDTAQETATRFQSDWPQGKDGFTVELGNLPKQSTSPSQVEAAKADVKERGAKGVGALDSDRYASLPAGNYVIYSGVFDTRADAADRLSELKGKFPDATVIEVSTARGGGGGGGGPTTRTVTVPNTDPVDSLTTPAARNSDEPVTASEEALEALDSATGEDYQEAVRNLPETIAIPGNAPPPDNEAPGAGSGAITIGGG